MMSLHTTPDELARIDAAARRILDQVRADLDAMAESRQAERDAYPSRDEGQLEDRMERQSWMEHNCHLLQDLVYLLAVGDRAPSDVAAADRDWPNAEPARLRLLEEGHAVKRRAALDRLSQAGYEFRDRARAGAG